MNQILEEISNIGVVPVVAIDHKYDAAPLADALTKAAFRVQKLHSVHLPRKSPYASWQISSRICCSVPVPY